mmetsp:Transcript_3020/g.4372  ORF Transcript_3020/g.4372 Transcript_3020/m.4372 type:complete len:133 (+) Transcript_3020:188-586(+)
MSEENKVSQKKKSSEIKEAEGDISVQLHSYRFLDTPVFIQLIKMKKSFYLWVGTQKPQMEHLGVSIMSNMDKLPSTTTVMGQDLDGTKSSLAQRLAKRTGMVAFVSYNIPENRDYLERFIQEKLAKLLPKKE